MSGAVTTASPTRAGRRDAFAVIFAYLPVVRVARNANDGA